MSAATSQTSGDFMICTATYQNGLEQHTYLIHIILMMVEIIILQTGKKLFAVVPGATVQKDVVQPFA